MKRLLFLSLLLLALTPRLQADNHWSLSFDPNDQGQANSTVVYAKLNLGQLPNEPDWTAYEVAAFIGEEVRAVVAAGRHANPSVASFVDNNYFALNVKGNFDQQGTSDNGKPITFKMWNTNTGIEYNLTCAQSITFGSNETTYGSSSDLIELSAVEVTALSFSNSTYTMNVGEKLDLAAQLELSPQGATQPNNLTWDYEQTYFTMTPDGVFEALAPTPQSTMVTVQAGNVSYNCYVRILQPATSVSLSQTAIEVTRDEYISDILTKIVSLQPQGATDEVLWESADETIVQPLQGGYVWLAAAVGQTTMKAYAAYRTEDGMLVKREGVAPATLTVTVVAPVIPVSGITLNFTDVECAVGDDLMSVMPQLYTVVSESGETPSNTSVKYSQPEGVTPGVIQVSADGATVSVVGKGSTVLRITSVANAQAYADINITVYNPAKDVTLPNSGITVTYNGNALDITSQVNGAMNFTPADHDPFTRGEMTVSLTDNQQIANVTMGYDNSQNWSLQQFVVNAAGTATIQVWFRYPNYLQNSLSKEAMTYTEVTRTMPLLVKQGLTGFDFSFNVPQPLKVGQTVTLAVTPQPQGVEFDAQSLVASFISYDLPEGWEFIEVLGKTVANGSVEFTLRPKMPFTGGLNLTYEGAEVLPNAPRVSANYAAWLSEGWQWRTYPVMKGVAVDELFPNHEADEVRSQQALMAYDANAGYFGELYEQGLSGNTAYKMKGSKAISLADANPIYGAQYPNNDWAVSQRLLKSWTWLAYPYFNSYPLSALTCLNPQEGDRIVSRANGFANYDGTKWVGSLTALSPEEAYLYYNNSGVVREMTWTAETELYSQHVDVAQVGPAGSRRYASPLLQGWNYEPKSYRDNMSVVARLDGFADLTHYTIGAYVDGECRGEGVAIDGRLYITVHANSGEQVSFRLRNTQTAEVQVIDQVVAVQATLGTLQQPLVLTISGSESQGISTVASDTATETTEATFDLNGRRVSQAAKGVVIRRTADGKVSKHILNAER